MKEILGTYVPGLWYLLKLEMLRLKIRRDPKAKAYTDIALSPSAQDGGRLFELYQQRQDNARQTTDLINMHAAAKH